MLWDVGASHPQYFEDFLPQSLSKFFSQELTSVIALKVAEGKFMLSNEKVGVDTI